MAADRSLIETYWCSRKEHNQTGISMHFSNVWAHAQAARCDAISSLILQAWRSLFPAGSPQSDKPATAILTSPPAQ
jgi:hypothetical protein